MLVILKLFFAKAKIKVPKYCRVGKLKTPESSLYRGMQRNSSIVKKMNKMPP